MVKKQYFTIEQANKILPEVKPLLKELMQLYQELGINENISIVYEEPFQETYAHVKNELFFHKKSYRCLKLIKQLMQLGVFVKDPRIGLIDFYSRHNDKEIFLCYRYPEKSIEFWHSEDLGYEARKHVSLLKLENNRSS